MSLKEKINLVKEQLGISEVDTQALEKALGKKLVDYESVEALVAALMGYYNGELKKKANTSHTHDYAPSSHKHKKADISDFPTSMKNPYALSIQLNSGTAYTYDGAATKNINITPASIGAADSSHTHTKANITDFPTSMKNPNALEIKMNGQNPVSYDGAAAKSINITASGIGAEPAFKKNGAFNKNFGTTSNTVLEGAKLAEILGLTYGGSLNTSSAKTVNYAYYDSTTKKVYKCIKATSINYADANYFEAISNNDLLGKLQNLDNYVEKVLWTGANTEVNSIFNLSISDENYDILVFEASLLNWGNNNHSPVFTLASKFKIDTTITIKPLNRYFLIKRISSTQYKILQASDGNKDNDKITRIIGIKL